VTFIGQARSIQALGTAYYGSSGPEKRVQGPEDPEGGRGGDRGDEGAAAAAARRRVLRLEEPLAGHPAWRRTMWPGSPPQLQRSYILSKVILASKALHTASTQQ
jgi:hypothetical protein